MNYIWKKLALFQLLLFVTLCVNAQGSFDELRMKGNEEIIKKNLEKAVAYFEEALLIGTEDQEQMAWVASVAATCSQQFNDKRKALHFYKIALNNQLTDQAVFETALNLAADLKDTESEEEILTIAAKQSVFQNERYVRKLMYFHFNNKQYQKVPPLAEQLLRKEPGKIETIYLKSLAELYTGDEKKAENGLMYIIAKDSLNLKAIRQLGFLYFNKGQNRYNEEKRKYNALMNPSRIDYANYLKALKKSFVFFEKASVFLEKANHMEPDEKVKQALFTLYARMNEKDKALKYKSN